MYEEGLWRSKGIFVEELVSLLLYVSSGDYTQVIRLSITGWHSPLPIESSC